MTVTSSTKGFRMADLSPAQKRALEVEKAKLDTQAESDRRESVRLQLKADKMRNERENFRKAR